MKNIFTTIVILVGIFLVGCLDVKETTAYQEQEITEKNQARLLANQPPPQLDWSLERDNITKRTELWNDPNKESYIYLINYGKVMAFFVIKGKVSSVNSQITNPQQVRSGGHSGAYWGTTLPSPAEDGSYGTNGDGIFFFLTDGTYCEWAGDYFLSDRPLKMATPPQLVRSIK